MIFNKNYKKPILLVGNGVRTADAVCMVHEFVKKTNIPLLTTMNGVDIAIFILALLVLMVIVLLI